MTPIDHSVKSTAEAMDLSIRLPTKAMDLSMASSSSKALCLVLPKGSPQEASVSPIDLRLIKTSSGNSSTLERTRYPDKFNPSNPERVYNLEEQYRSAEEEGWKNDCKQHRVYPSSTEGLQIISKHNMIQAVNNEVHSDVERAYSETCSEDPDFNTENISDNDESEDGDPTLLNDLTIYEYFQSYNTVGSDSELNDDSDEKVENTPKNMVENEDIQFSRKRSRSKL